MSDLIGRAKAYCFRSHVSINKCLMCELTARIEELEAENKQLSDRFCGRHHRVALFCAECLEELEADKEVLLCGMNSIANSSCCEDCQEAKKVAVKCINDLAALEQSDE